MKILHICCYYSPHIGGIEQVAKDCVDSLQGYEQKLICFNHEKGSRTDVVGGVEIIRVGCQAKISSQSIALGYGKALKKIMREFVPDTVIFHYPNPFLAHYLLKYKKKSFKLIIYWHLDIFKQKILKLFFRGQNKRLCERADLIVATSPNYIDNSDYLSQYKNKCIVIPNCVRTDRFIIDEKVLESADKLKEQYPQQTILFAMGRHVPYKGLEYLVKASRFLDNSYKIFIGGKGPLTDELKELAKGDSKITFTGRISDDEVPTYLAACDIFCFPSITKNEAFGIALAEAMYFGKPAVTFTIKGSGVNYVSLNGVTGIEVENGNVQKYAEAIKQLAINPTLRIEYGKNAKERVVNNFTFEIFSQKVNDAVDGLYKE